MANITGDGNFTRKLNQALNSSLLSSPPAGVIEIFSALNTFLSITASIGNVLILIALHKVSSIYHPTKLFFRCLAVTDLGVGLLAQPLYATFMLTFFTDMNVNARRSIWYATGVSSWILCGVSILTTAAISVDRLLALLLGLRYRHVVTLRRVRVVIICFWLVGAFFWVNDNVQIRYRPQSILCFLASFAGNFDFLLHKYLLQTTTSRSPSTRPCASRTSEWRREFTEHSKIQKVRFLCFVGAAGISFLLCSFDHCLRVIYQPNLNSCGRASCRDSGVL